VNPLGASLSVTSKTYGLPGLRIGWLATRNEALRKRIAALKDYTTICNSAPSEYLATIAMRHREALTARTMGILRSNLALLDAFMARHADTFDHIRPEGSPMCFPNYKKGDINAFADRCVKECGVLLLPGAIYDDPDNHFRVGYGRKNFGEALGVFETWLAGQR
jgi:aspartate/methionine/tyrosine aminotransferase